MAAPPTWVPPEVPQLPSEEPVAPGPDRWRAVVGGLSLAFVVCLAFALGAVAWDARLSPTVEPPPDPTLASVDTREGVDVADRLLTAMVEDRWDDAFALFHPGCIDFSATLFQTGFDPLLDTYESHEFGQPANGDLAPGDIVLVRGEVDLGDVNTNPVRVELVWPGTDSPSEWQLCGLRIDEP